MFIIFPRAADLYPPGEANQEKIREDRNNDGEPQAKVPREKEDRDQGEEEEKTDRPRHRMAHRVLDRRHIAHDRLRKIREIVL